MTRMVGRTLVLFASILCAGALTAPLHAQDAALQGASETTISNVSAQLGIKLQSPQSDELRLGVSFTAVLEQPDKIAELGITGMHSGARVTVTRVAADKVRVEADEMEPVSHSATIDLHLGPKGELSKLPKS